MSLTKHGAAQLAANKLTRSQNDDVADRYLEWLEAKPQLHAAMDALLGAADMSKHPERVLVRAEELYAEMAAFPAPAGSAPQFISTFGARVTYSTPYTTSKALGAQHYWDDLLATESLVDMNLDNAQPTTWVALEEADPEASMAGDRVVPHIKEAGVYCVWIDVGQSNGAAVDLQGTLSTYDPQPMISTLFVKGRADTHFGWPMIALPANAPVDFDLARHSGSGISLTRIDVYITKIF